MFRNPVLKVVSVSSVIGSICTAKDIDPEIHGTYFARTWRYLYFDKPGLSWFKNSLFDKLRGAEDSHKYSDHFARPEHRRRMNGGDFL